MAWRAQLGDSKPRLFAQAGLILLLATGSGLGVAAWSEGAGRRRARDGGIFPMLDRLAYWTNPAVCWARLMGAC
jgi:hypothetical protein